ncbi:MAG: FG-GAP repeat protein [Planctomycetes bacterium]|nr:FG-GAP repeat protein [Planctomycetota bacterium]
MDDRLIRRTTVVCALAATLSAQSVIYSQRGADDDRLGRAVADLGDVDGDGIRDHAVGAPRDGLSPPGTGRVVVCSGATGMPLYTVSATTAGTAFGHAVRGCGDVDGDGRPDFLVGAPDDASAGTGAGATFLFSGRDGRLLRQLLPLAAGERFGHSVSGVGDTNGDGTPDLLVGAPAAAGGGAAYLIEGRDGSVLFRFGADLGDLEFGFCVRGLDDDADGDGHPDLLIGAPRGRTMVNHDETGYVRVVSGHSGRILWMFYGTAPGGRAGWSLSPTDDDDGDGVRDVVVGMPGLSPGGAQSGAALVYSARTGAYLRSFPGGAALDRLGTLVEGLGDIDGDGRGDLLLVEGRSNVADAVVHSGATGAPLFTLPRLTGDSTYWSVAAAGDVDGDGHADLLVGGPNSWNGSDRGVAHLFAGVTRRLSADVYAVRVRSTDRQVLSLRAGAEHAGRTYLMLGSLSGTTPGVALGTIRLPLNYDFYFDLLAQAPNVIVTNSFATLDSSGNATATFAFAGSLQNSMAGLLLHHAYLVFGPQLASIELASNAVPLTTLPRR